MDIFTYWKRLAVHMQSEEMRAFEAMRHAGSYEEWMRLMQMQAAFHKLHDQMMGADSLPVSEDAKMIREYERMTGRKHHD